MLLTSNGKDESSISVILIGIYYLVSPMEDVFNTSYGTFSKYIMLLVFAVIVFSIIKAGRIFYPRELLFLLGFPLAMIIVSWLSCIWSINIGETLETNIVYTLLPLALIVLCLPNYSKKNIDFIIKCYIIGGLIMVVYLIAFYQGSLFTVGRISLSEDSDPNGMACRMLGPTIIIFHYLFELGGKRKVFLGIILFLFALIIFLSGSRGTLIAFVAVIAISILRIRKNESVLKKIVMIIGIIIIGYCIVIVLPTELFERFFSESSYQNTINAEGQRLYIWKIVTNQIIPNMTAVGLGSGCGSIALASFFGEIIGVHNTYLNMILEYGILGISVYSVFLYKLIRRLIRAKDYMAMDLIIGISIAIVFLDSYGTKYFWNIIYLCALLLKMHQNTNQESGE